MKKNIIALILFLQFCLLLTLMFYFNQKGVTWNDLGKGGNLQALRTTAGGSVAADINSTIDTFFSEMSSECAAPQYSLKEVENSRELCIIEISVVDTESSVLKKNIYELWIVLNKKEPFVYMKNVSETQDFDFLPQSK